MLMKKTEPMNLTFDKEKHAYFLGNQELVSVTNSLKLGGLIDDRWFTQAGRDRGIAVHEAIFLDISNDLYFDGLHPIIKPYLEAWRRFRADTGFIPTVELCEKRQYHPIHLYAGTPDCVGLLNRRHIVLDFKTGDVGTAGYQLAAYREFPRIIAYQPDRFSLRLMPNGQYRLKQHDDPTDWHVFYNNLLKVRLAA